MLPKLLILADITLLSSIAVVVILMINYGDDNDGDYGDDKQQ